VALLIDTTLLVGLERGDGSLETLGDEEAAISVVTVSELLHGVHRARGARQTRRRAVVEAILAAFDAIPITEPVARIHADIWAQLSRRGSVIGNHHLWIAATALAHGFGVATGDAWDFSRVPGLRVLALAG
jgi:tRNA(fMet)-specific endonuclease VapC